MPDTAVLGTLYGSPVDHFNQDTGHSVLSVAEQINRTVALDLALKDTAASTVLGLALGHLMALLEAETLAAMARIRPLSKSMKGA